MKQILIISGKGGTGKTTVTGALADLASKEISLVLADADVDAANLELLLEPTLQETHPFKAGKTVVIDQELCIQCGQCEAACRFDAVDILTDGTYAINESMCEGCLSCFHQCPTDAITAQEETSGEWYRSLTPYGPLFHALLYPAEENSGKLVTDIKNEARKSAKTEKADLLLIDGPPGIGCPVTAACQGTDAAVIVSEPTISGIHDLKRVKQTADHFNIPSYLILNKCDLNTNFRDQFIHFAEDEGIKIMGEIPYAEKILYAQAKGKPVTQTLEAEDTLAFRKIWDEIRDSIIEAPK